MFRKNEFNFFVLVTLSTLVSPTLINPSLSRNQAAFLPAWRKEGDTVNSSSVSLRWDSAQILLLFVSLYQYFCPVSVWV